MSRPRPITNGLSLIFFDLSANATAQGSSSQASIPSVTRIIIFLHLSHGGKSSAEYSSERAIGVVPLGTRLLILFIILPLNIKTQQEEGKRSYGTPTSAPINANIKKKMILVTLLSSIIWLISMVLIYIIFLV